MANERKNRKALEAKKLEAKNNPLLSDKWWLNPIVTVPVNQAQKKRVMDTAFWHGVQGANKTFRMPSTAMGMGLPKGEGPETWYVGYTDEVREFFLKGIKGCMKEEGINKTIYEDVSFFSGTKAFILPCKDENEFNQISAIFKKWMTPMLDHLRTESKGLIDINLH